MNSRFLGFVLSLDSVVPIRIIAHGDALGDGYSEIDRRAGRQGLSPVALHAQERAADVDLVIDDIAEERAFDDRASKHVDGRQPDSPVAETDCLRADGDR